MTGHVRYKDNDYIEVFDAVPWLFGVPFAYLRIGTATSTRTTASGWCPVTPGSWGAYMLWAVMLLNIYRSPVRERPQVDGTTRLDYRTKRRWPSARTCVVISRSTGAADSNHTTLGTKTRPTGGATETGRLT